MIDAEIWGVRIWHPLIFERQILKQTLKWAPHLSPLSLPAAIWNIKDTESPSAFKRTVKCSTFLVRFLKWSHLKAICLHWNLTCHCYRELSLHGASADGDRHPSSAAFTKRYLMSCRPAEQCVSLKICQNVLKQSRKCVHLFLLSLSKEGEIPEVIKK